MQCHIEMQTNTMIIGANAKMISLMYMIREKGLLLMSPLNSFKKQSTVRNWVAIEEAGWIEAKKFCNLDGHARLKDAVIVSS